MCPSSFKFLLPNLDFVTSAETHRQLAQGPTPLLLSSYSSLADLSFSPQQTNDYWVSWIGKATYKGRWRESVLRQALTLKMMVFEETGAIIAAPTFSLPEHIGGGRNWDCKLTPFASVMSLWRVLMGLYLSS